MFRIFAAVNTRQLQKHFINAVMLNAGRHLLQGCHYALAEIMVYVECKSTELVGV